MFHRIVLVIALLAAQFGLAAQAYACKGDKVLFDDDFKAHDSMWGASADSFEIKNGTATLRPDAHKGWVKSNSGFAFGDADICVTVARAKTGYVAANAGLAFWLQDYDNYYAAIITSGGRFFVARMLEGKWGINPVSLTQTDAIKQETDQLNSLRVTLKGQSVVIAINDKEVIRFRAQAPERQSYIGLFAESAEDTPAVAQFTNLKVTNVK